MVFITPHFEKGWREVLFLRLSGRKSDSDGGLKNDTTWTDQQADKLHKPVIKIFPKRKVYVNGIDKIWLQILSKCKHFQSPTVGSGIFSH